MAMGDAMVSNKTGLLSSGAVRLCARGSARIAYLPKAQIQFKLLAIGIRHVAAEATGERRVGVESKSQKAIARTAVDP
jgi:hypothetical protein